MEFLKRWKIHILALILVIIAEFIGIKPISLGPVSFSLLPMLYALVLGILLSRIPGLLNNDDMVRASSNIGIAVMFLIAYTAASIGPNLKEVLSAGPALILQELGNLGTVFFAIPIAVLVFKMDRTAIGSAFSTSRETSMAIVGSLYGLDSPEGRGVMGSYITGTLLGTIFNGILAGLLLNVTWFSPESLAMAAGTGSASMMSAAMAPIIEAFPEKADILQGFTATSQVLTSVDGIYMSLFVAIPLSEWMYKKLKGKEAVEQELRELGRTGDVHVRDAKVSEESTGIDWAKTIKVLLISGALAMVAFYVSAINKGEPIRFLDSLPGMLWLLGIVLAGNLLDHLVSKLGLNLPTILYIALLSSILSIPTLWSGATVFTDSIAGLGLLPLCTPILAYAGIGTGKDMAAFKEQGVKIVIVTLFALMGTYVGSAVISNIVLKVMGRV